MKSGQPLKQPLFHFPQLDLGVLTNASKVQSRRDNGLMRRRGFYNSLYGKAAGITGFKRSAFGITGFKRSAFGITGFKRSAFGITGFKRSAFGFTLAELLISLAILGVIATFAIPKVLNSQQDTQFKSSAKEVAGMISGAHQTLKVQGQLDSNTTRNDFTPYFNYVRVKTAGLVDSLQTQTTHDCSTRLCLVLHNGGVVHFSNGTAIYGGTGSNAALPFVFDPDGKVTDGATNGPGKSVQLWIYYDGKVRTKGTIESSTCFTPGGGWCENPQPLKDPPWFSWD